MTYFGSIATAPAIEAAILSVLEEWMDTYIAEVERQEGITAQSIALPAFYGTSIEADIFPGERLPAIIVVSPGTDGEPMQKEEGRWEAWFQATVVAMVQTPNDQSARRLAGLYASAIRALMIQQGGSMDGATNGIWWVGEEYQGEPGSERNRTRAAALVHFRVKVDIAAQGYLGPAEVPAHPYLAPDDLPEVASVEIDVDQDEG